MPIMRGNKKRKAIVQQASVLKRLIAFIIDLFIINTIILFPFKKALEELIPSQSFSKTFEFVNNMNNSTSLTIIIVAISFVIILYFMILEKNLNQTPGKMLFNLYVTSQTKDLKYWQLFVRSMFLILLFPFILLLFIDPIVMIFSKEKQRLSEILSKTKVVEHTL
jgi:uncharacterized RDD family membrane protein YckC